LRRDLAPDDAPGELLRGPQSVDQIILHLAGSGIQQPIAWRTTAEIVSASS
jgi:hypothetical protein